MLYVTTDALVAIATEITGTTAAVRDYGLLDAAAHRPQAIVFGYEAYPTLHLKAAALLDSVVRNHPLVDGNKRLAFTATAVFYGLNGYDIDPPSADAGADFVIAVAVEHPPMEEIAKQLESWAQPRP